MRDRDRPSSLDAVPLEDRFPIRNVALFCDRGCGTEVSGDICADTAEQAYEGLRKIAVAEHGWLVTDTEDVCPDCQVGISARWTTVDSFTEISSDDRGWFYRQYYPAENGESVLVGPFGPYRSSEEARKYADDDVRYWLGG